VDAGFDHAKPGLQEDRYVSNNREAGIAEENKAIAQGSLAYFGTYPSGTSGLI
jgi:hypothetical protein